jgi:hypothetical protein
LIEAIQALGVMLDSFAYAVGAKHVEEEIFGNLDDKEAGILADIWLEQAESSTKSRARMRGFIRIHRKYVKAGIILAPRAARLMMKLWIEGIGFA